jgi:retron-type reverse transcriptase
MSHESNVNVGGESDGRVLPTKCPNKDGKPSAEGTEERRPTKENTVQATASQMQSWGNALDGLRRVREAAKRDKRLRFTALLHHVSVALLSNSFYALKREAAPGVDRLTWWIYETDLDKRLEDLHSRVHRGTYRALPSKRTYIPKPDGRQRPLGIAALEDKIVQHALGTVLSQIYEEDFLGFSYGFRSGRGTHDALDALWIGIMRKKVNWVLDADIRDCFGSFSHEWMVKFLQHRIGDRRILRLIRKWLRAGVLEDGEWTETEKGTPQGSVLTPLTQKVTSNLNGWSRAGGGALRYLTCVLRGNMFMAYDSVDQSGQGSAAERRSRPARAACRVARGSAAVVTQVRPVSASSIPVPGGSLPARPAGRSHGGYGTDHAQASAEHGASAAGVCEEQWPDYRSDRDTRAERVSRCSKKAWLSRAQEAAGFKSTSTMRLIACASRSSPKPTIFWCPAGSAPSVGV